MARVAGQVISRIKVALPWQQQGQTTQQQQKQTIKTEEGKSENKCQQSRLSVANNARGLQKAPSAMIVTMVAGAPASSSFATKPKHKRTPRS